MPSRPSKLATRLVTSRRTPSVKLTSTSRPCSALMLSVDTDAEFCQDLGAVPTAVGGTAPDPHGGNRLNFVVSATGLEPLRNGVESGVYVVLHPTHLLLKASEHVPQLSGLRLWRHACKHTSPGSRLWSLWGAVKVQGLTTPPRKSDASRRSVPRGSREGLTAAQAEAELRRLMREVAPATASADRLDVGEVGRRYCAHLNALGRRRSTLTAVEMVLRVNALADAAVPGNHRQLDRALYFTAAMSGLRQGELIALRWQDIDWIGKRIRVTRNHVLGQFDTRKSRRSARSVPLSSHLVHELRAWQRATIWRDPDALVFAEPASGDVLRRGALMRRYRRALKAAKIDPHRFHDLRHTFGTAMAAAGVPMRTLQEWMGHGDIATTQRYADYAPNEREVEMVDRAFGGVDGA
jgi:integrase